MSSTHQPSSSSWMSQEPASCSYDCAVGLNSQVWAIQRILTRCPRNGDRSNFVCTQFPVPVVPASPGPGHSFVVVWSHCQPQCAQIPSGQHIVSCTPRGAGGAVPVSVGVSSQYVRLVPKSLQTCGMWS